MKKNVVIITVCLFTLVLLTGCLGSGKELGDEAFINEQLDSFEEGVKNENRDKIASTLNSTVIDKYYDDSGNIIDEFTRTKEEEINKILNGEIAGAILKFKNRVISISEDTATVDASFYTEVNGDENVQPITLTMVKKDDDWYINIMEFFQ
jgi:hypothetical protein